MYVVCHNLAGDHCRWGQRSNENRYPRVGQGKTDSLKAWQVEKGEDLGKGQGQKGRTQQKGEQIHRRVL